MHKWGGRIKMTKEEKQAALEALDSSVEGGTFCVHFPQEYQTIRAALTAQEQIDALYGTIKSQKQTHDALIKMNKEMIESLNNTRAMIYAIWEGAQRTDIDHEQFRIKVGEWVRDWLNDDLLKIEQAISRAEAQKVGED